MNRFLVALVLSKELVDLSGDSALVDPRVAQGCLHRFFYGVVQEKRVLMEERAEELPEFRVLVVKAATVHSQRVRRYRTGYAVIIWNVPSETF